MYNKRRGTSQNFNGCKQIIILQVNFQWDDDEVRFVLDQHAELDLYSASSLKQQSTDRHVAPLGHIFFSEKNIIKVKWSSP
jgi:hypothetical protein